jgi:2-polyprenyl-3-methyl-5-hydroxy-6-metoxy-1,4-benzoquinol methylase
MNEQTTKNLLKMVKRNYQAIACQFDNTRRKRNWPELEQFVSQISTVDRQLKVLDVGCGNGRLLELFTDKDINYLGVDNCSELISIAQDKYRDQTQVEFRICDVFKLSELPEINFDYIFSIAMLHHLPSYKLRLEAIKQLKNKVKPDGVIFISVWKHWQQAKYRKLIIKHWILKLLGKHQMDLGDIIFDWKSSQGQIISQRYYHAFTARELKKLAHDANLTVQKIYKDKFNYYLALSK